MSPIYAIQLPTYMPVMRVIINITQAEQALITTSFPHGYITGTIVRINIPPAWGMPQIDQEVGSIVVTGPTTFLITIDTRFFQAFIVPIIYEDVPQVVPIGSDAFTYEPAVHNVLT